MISSMIWIDYQFDIRICTFYLGPEKLLARPLTKTNKEIIMAILFRIFKSLAPLYSDQYLISISLPLSYYIIQFNAIQYWSHHHLVSIYRILSPDQGG